MRLQLRPIWVVLLALVCVGAWNVWKNTQTLGWRAHQAAGDWICSSGDPAQYSAWRLRTELADIAQIALALDAESGAGTMRTISFLDEGEKVFSGLLAWGGLEEPGQDRMQVASLAFPDRDDGALFHLNRVPHTCYRLPQDRNFSVLRDAARAFASGGPPLRHVEAGFGAVLEDAWRRSSGH